jgi:hypothetical protein
MHRSHWRRFAVAVAGVALVAVVVAQIIDVHSETGRWGITVSAARVPSRLHFEGRDYDKGDQLKLPSDAVQRGHTAGGGTIFKPSGDQDYLSVVIYVSDGKRAWGYGLVGGP